MRHEILRKISNDYRCSSRDEKKELKSKELKSRRKSLR